MWRWWPRGRHVSDVGNADPITREKERALRLFGEQPAEELHPYAIDPVVPAAPAPAALPVPHEAPIHWRMAITAFGILAGGILGLVLFADDPKLLLVGPKKLLTEISGTTGYIDCAHARLVGAAPLKKGDKGYSARLDVDGDGIACEPLMPNGESSEVPPAPAPAKKKPKRKHRAS